MSYHECSTVSISFLLLRGHFQAVISEIGDDQGWKGRQRSSLHLYPGFTQISDGRWATPSHLLRRVDNVLQITAGSGKSSTSSLLAVLNQTALPVGTGYFQLMLNLFLSLLSNTGVDCMNVDYMLFMLTVRLCKHILSTEHTGTKCTISTVLNKCQRPF